MRGGRSSGAAGVVFFGVTEERRQILTHERVQHRLLWAVTLVGATLDDGRTRGHARASWRKSCARRREGVGVASAEFLGVSCGHA